MKTSRLLLVFLASTIAGFSQNAAGETPEKALEQLRTEIRAELRSSLDKADEETNGRLVRIEGVLIEVLPTKDIGSGNLARTLAGLTQLRGLSRSPKVNALATELSTHIREAIAKSQREFVEAYRPALRKAFIDGLKAETSADVDKPLAAALGLKRKMATFVDADNNELELVDSDEVDTVVNILNTWQIGLQNALAEFPEPSIAAMVIQRAEQSYDEDLSEFMARSEMLELIGAARVRWNLKAQFQAEDARKIAEAKAALRKVAKLEDLPAAIEALGTAAGGRHPFAVPGPVADLEPALLELQRNYQELKSGASSGLPAMPSFSNPAPSSVSATNPIDTLISGNFGPGNFGPASFIQAEAPGIKVPSVFAQEFGAIHELLLRFALSRALGGAEAPAETESLPAYLSRHAAASLKDKDWARLGKILDAVQHLRADSVYGTSDILALRFMLSGHNLERARQFPAAVAAYLAALKSGSQAVPAEWIGGQLEGIQKAHPEAYEAGQKLTAELPRLSHTTAKPPPVTSQTNK